MRQGHLWIAGIGLLTLIGAPLLLRPPFRCLSVSSRVVLSTAVGIVILSFVMNTFALLRIPWHPISLSLTAAALSLSLTRLLRGASGPIPTAGSPRAFAPIARLVSSTAVLVTFLAVFQASATSPDLLYFWGPKAAQFAESRTIDAAYLGSPHLNYMHASYPPLLTNAYSFLTMIARRFPWGAATLLFPLSLMAIATALPGILRIGNPPSIALTTSALIVATIACIGSRADIAGGADPVLLLFETLALALTFSPAGTTRGGALLIGLLVAGCAATKLEGLPLGALIAFAALTKLPKRDRVVFGSIALAAPLLLSLGAWFLFGAARGVFAGYDVIGPPLSADLGKTASTLILVIKQLGSQWYGFAYLLPLAICIIAPSHGRLRRPLIAIAFGQAAFLLFAYLHGSQDATSWIQWSAERVFLPISAALAFAQCGDRRITPLNPRPPSSGVQPFRIPTSAERRRADLRALFRIRLKFSTARAEAE